MKNQRYVFAARRDRLGARLGNLLSAWEFAQKTDRKLVINWEDYADLQNGSFSFFDFFEDLGSRFDDLGLAVDTGSRIKFYERDDVKSAIKSTSFSHETVSFWKSLDADVLYQATVRHKFGNETQNDEDVRPKLFGYLSIKTEIRKAIGEILESRHTKDCIAVHIREGDIHSLLRDIPHDASDDQKRSLVASFASRFAPQSAYISAIDAFPDSTIFVFSDGDATRAKLTEMFRGRIVDCRDDITRHDLSDGQVAFCEINIMMRMRKVISTRSAFPTIAVNLSDCEAQSIFPYVNQDDLWEAIESQIKDRSDRDDLIIYLEEYYRRLFKSKRTLIRNEIAS